MVTKNQILSLGGGDPSDLTKLTMDKYFATGFLTKCNLKGGLGKIAFDGSKCYEIIVESILETYPTAKEKAIRTQIGNKLKNSLATFKRRLQDSFFFLKVLN